MDGAVTIDRVFARAAELVEEWGSSYVQGVTLRVFLTFSGVSLWDVMAASLAAYDVPQALAQLNSFTKKPSYRECVRSMLRVFKPHLKLARDAFRERKKGRALFGGLEISRLDRCANGVLVLAFEPRQMAGLDSVLDLLEAQGLCSAIVGSNRTPVNEAYLREFCRAFLPEESIFSEAIRDETRDRRRVLRERLTAVHKQRFFERLECDGRPLWPHLQRSVRSLLTYDSWSLIRATIVAQWVLIRLRPRIVVGADDCDPRARTYFLAAKSQNIPTLHIQYGVASSRAVNWRFMCTDRVAIMDSLTYSKLLDMGLDRNRLVVTGQPRFDALIQRGSTATQVHHEYGIEPNQFIVLFASQPYVPGSFASEAERRYLVAAVYAAIAERTDITLLVKPHPDEDTGYHTWLSKKIQKIQARAAIRLVPRSANIQDLILGSDVVVTFHSTSALEALVAGKPVLLVDGLSFDCYQDYVDSGAMLQVAPDGIAPALADILARGELDRRLRAGRERCIGAQTGLLDGRAAQRCADLIMSMLQERRCLHAESI